MDKRKVIYYDDELNDEFSLAQIEAKRIDSSYVYCHDSRFKRFTHFFWYRMVATPLAFLYLKFKFSHRIVGKEKIKEYKKCGYFLFGNHTQDIGDALIPNMINVKKDKYMIVHPNNVSIPYVGRVTPSLGALPLPDDRAAYKNFIMAVERRYREGAGIVIYPEAHIWPYYTGIRNFKDDSFYYPVKLSSPVFSFTNTYQKKKFFPGVRITTYIDGPFFPDGDVSASEARKKLRDSVYCAMLERSKKSTFEKIKYIKREENND